jgi:hypothetical protein
MKICHLRTSSLPRRISLHFIHLYLKNDNPLPGDSENCFDFSRLPTTFFLTRSRDTKSKTQISPEPRDSFFSLFKNDRLDKQTLKSSDINIKEGEIFAIVFKIEVKFEEKMEKENTIVVLRRT